MRTVTLAIAAIGRWVLAVKTSVASAPLLIVLSPGNAGASYAALGQDKRHAVGDRCALVSIRARAGGIPLTSISPSCHHSCAQPTFSDIAWT